MFLKELQMTGFKSFAQTVQLQLEPGVTGVVGPNGSGKSNIVDAVRWVLGEQSARALRGARSEDVIFAGSAMRRPLGMAEVTLVLDNSDRRVALDLEEIAIARRLYRSGDTEYLLNHRRARLRDVLDVAAQAGLGPDSYCVVGQGAIEQLALMRPQERRSLIADAADIRRYEARLAEIENDLSQTQQNALRVSAVVAEVRPQLDRLKAQAERAQKHRDYRDEVELLATSWYGRALPAARAAHEAAERRRRSLGEAVEAIREELAAIEQRRARLHDVGAAARERASRAERQLQEARAGRERDRVDRATAAERRQFVVDRASAVQTELTDLAAQLAAARETLAQSTAAVEGAVAPMPVMGDTTALLADAQAQVERARVARGRAEADLQRQRNALAGLERDEMRVRARAEGVEMTEGQRADAEARRTRLVAGQREAETALNAAREALREVERRQAPARADVDRALNARRGVESALTTARRTLDGLQGEERGLARLKAGPERRGKARLLGDEIAVPARYRRAILVALGSAAQYQVVEATDTAWFVQEHPADGGAEPVLVPIHRPAEEPALAEVREWLVRTLADRVKFVLAADLASGAPGSVFARYLGATVIVPTVDDARAAATLLAAAQPDGRGGFPFQVASEDGHCLRWNGEHRVGPRAAEAQALQLEERRAALTVAIAEAQSTMADREREVAEASRGEASARAALRGLDEERARAANDVREQELALRGVRAELDAEEKRLARLAVSQADASIPAQLAELAARQEALRGQARDLEQALRARSDELGAAQAALRSANEQHAALAAQRALAEERRARLRDAMQRDAREVERLTSRHNALQSESSRLAQDEKLLTERLRGIDGQLREWDRTVELSEQETAAATAALEQNATAAESIAREFESAQGRLADARAEQAAAGADAEHAGGAVARLDAEIAGVAEALSIDRSALLRQPQAGSELASLDDAALQRRLARAQRELRSVGAVDYGVLAEYATVRDRYQFLTDQLDDLARTETSIREGMVEARDRMRAQFLSAFDAVNDRFKEMFRELFRGGEGELALSGDPDSTQCGIDIAAQPPGKRLHRLATLSGGERSLVGAALLLALISVNPSPFCMLDEVDAALDETNVTRFVSTIREMARQTQFVLVTHNRATMEMADALYGVTMSPGAISQVVSVRFEALTP